MSGHHCVVEDKKADAVTHLAIARSQNTENGILGGKSNTNDKGSCESNCLICFYDLYFQIHKQSNPAINSKSSKLLNRMPKLFPEGGE